MTQATRAELSSALKHAIEVMNENCATVVLSQFESGETNHRDDLKAIGKSLKEEVERLGKILTPPLEK